jgi:hypothetical protein
MCGGADLRLQPRQRPERNGLQALPEVGVLHSQPAAHARRSAPKAS